MLFLTDFADEAVVLPLMLAVSVMLVLLGWYRGSAAWALAAGMTLGAMLLFKLVAIACGPVHLRTPSGHTAVAALITGSLAAILVPRRHCLAAAVAGITGAAVMGFSRLELEMHTTPEVMLGAAVGIGGAVGFALLSGARPPRLQFRWIALTVVLVLSVFHGSRVGAEPRIWRVAYWLAHDLHVCRGGEPWPLFHDQLSWRAIRL